MQEIIAQVISYLFASLFVVEVTPIKVSPLKWLGKRLNGDMLDRIERLEKQFLDGKVDTMRTEILDFANSCRNGRKHTFEEWDHIIEVLGKYERICKEHDIENDKLPLNARYLRELHYTLSIDGRFEEKRKNGELLEVE